MMSTMASIIVHILIFYCYIGPGGRPQIYCTGSTEYDMLSPADWLLAIAWKPSNSVNNILY